MRNVCFHIKYTHFFKRNLGQASVLKVFFVMSSTQNFLKPGFDVVFVGHRGLHSFWKDQMETQLKDW